MKKVTFYQAWFAQPIIYGLPAWPLAMLGIPLYVYLPTYYYELGLELAVVGLMLLLARVTDVVTDPFIGAWRDQLTARGRYGLMLLGWGLLMISLWQLLLPAEVSDGQLLIWALLVYLAWTLIMIPYQALTAEVTRLHHRKTHYTASREAFAILGVVSVLILPFLLAEPDNYRGLFEVLYGLVAISLTLALGLLIWRLRLIPQAATSSTDAQTTSESGRRLRSLQAFKPGGVAQLIWQDPASRRLLPAYFVNSLANALPATLFLLFVQYYLELTPYTGLLLLSFFFAGVLALPGWVKLADKLGKYRVWQFSILLACFSFSWVFVLEPGDLWLFLAISFFSGLSLGADVALPSSIQADIAQRLSRTRPGGSVSGVLFGIWGMLTKLALALAVGLAFPLLDWAGWAQQTDASLNLLIWLYAGLPIALKILVLIWLRKAL